MKAMPKAVWQVQPDHEKWDAWQRMAQDEQMLYEIMEPVQAARSLLQEDEMRARCMSSRRVNALHGAFIDVNPASGDPGVRALSIQRCRRSCEVAAQIGLAM